MLWCVFCMFCMFLHVFAHSCAFCMVLPVFDLLRCSVLFDSCFGWNAKAMTCPGFLALAVGLVLTVARALAGTRRR